MALFLVGTGVSFDMTIFGMDTVSSCKEVFIETYTNPIGESKIASLEAKTGKKIERIGRDRLESDYLVDRAKSSDVCLLVSGDPLTATTHITLVLGAKKKGVPVKVIHNSSIYSAAPARSGLQIYRFGKTASLVNPRPNYKPASSLEIIRQNLKNGMHTLVLLDTEPRPMDAKEALEMLSEFGEATVLSRVGETDEKIAYGKIKDLKNKELGRPPFCIIVPAKLHLMEQEFLDSL